MSNERLLVVLFPPDADSPDPLHDHYIVAPESYHKTGELRNQIDEAKTTATE